MAVEELDRTFEELLVVCVQTGDRRAAERLAVRWRPRLLRAARRMLRNEEQAQDCAQEAWIGICRGLIRLSDPARFPAWAFGVLRRKCADRIRAERSARVRDAERQGAEEASEPGRGEERVALLRAFDALTPDHRIAAVLFFQEGLSLAEVALATSVPVGTAKSRIFHARRHLKSTLSGAGT